MNEQDLIGTFQGTTYIEANPDHDATRLILTCTTDEPETDETLFYEWSVQALDSELGWYDVSSSPIRQQFSFERALELGRAERARIAKALQNPHIPMNKRGKR